ncbi:MAG: hypothetical protein LQ352_003268 [Teloschistes flavicans]|nr:MAG: hypothetical protein LQ352_003268 [Teloschistes flavicans]
MADDTAAEETPVTFNIKSSSDAKYVLTLPLSLTVLDLKNKLATTEYADIPSERQRLIYSGRVLKDADTLASYKIKEGNTVHLVKGAASNQRQNPANQGSAATTAGAGPPTGAQGVPANLATGTGNNPLAGLTGARYAGLAQLPGAGMFGPDGGMGAPPGPEQMAEMLQNPQYASQLNEVLSNPDLINSMIDGNPMLRGMGDSARQALNNPQFRRMMTDPDMLRQMAQMQRQFPGMFGGMGGMGGAQNEAFPAPGITDQTPDQPSNERTATPNQPNTTPQQPPMNPFGTMFGNPAGGGGGGAAAANPFAGLFPQAQQQQPSTTGGNNNDSTPIPSQANPSSTAQQPQNNNPFQQMAAQIASDPAFMQNMLGMLGGGGTGAGSPNTGNPQNPNAAAFNPFASMFGPGGMGAAGNPFGGGFGAAPPPQQPPDTRPPEERYAEQLRQLNEMGFYEFERNVEALRRTGGSVQGAVEYLLTH